MTVQDIYNTTNDMRKAGELAPAAASKSAKPMKKNHRKGNKGKDEFQEAIAGEIETVETEIGRMTALMGSYDKSNAGFAIFLEKKIEKETKKLELLKELHKN